MWQDIPKHRYFVGVLAGIFLVSLFAGLFFAPKSMDMATGNIGCPFMLHEETLCSMGALDHVGVWKSAFAAVLPALTLLLLAAFPAFVAHSILPPFLDRRRSGTYYFARAFLQRIYTFIQRPLQELFSRGILHPKLF